jgi:Domain of unknown function (DUF4417)
LLKPPQVKFDIDTWQRMFLLGGMPVAYPYGHPVEGPQHIPVLRGIMLSDSPKLLVPFDDRDRWGSHADLGLHMYRDDMKFARVLTNPENYVERFSAFKLVITPDFSLGRGMPEWMKWQHIALSRAVGVVWQQRGLNVVANLRWLGPEDYDVVVCGVPANSIFACSMYGAVDNKDELAIFMVGLHEMVRRLSPEKVLVYGVPARWNLQAEVGSSTQIIQYPASYQTKRPAPIFDPRLSQLEFGD